MHETPPPITARKSVSTTSAMPTSPATTAPTTQPAGRVSFVGAGPGDASLLTVRAAELLAQADVVLAESPEQLALVTNGAEIVDGGTNAAGEPLTHAARGKLVVKHAKTGAHVVRLIVGDPFTYATGPEEAMACAKAGITFELVPGVSSVSAVPAYAGVPLTDKQHREFTVVSVGDSPSTGRGRASRDARPALGRDPHRRGRRRPRRRRSLARDARLDDPRGHHRPRRTTVVSTLAEIARRTPRPPA